ncbi:hypothetical protein CAPTEDRAFT_193286 [Capitella teleta]|uniref:Uncharacterized protein n=1 Tax=Capitella teleta TaxID=283909 RepID=R7UTZ8_CAPTE|nr:hypothetical protein CAPTEDRAFT_193286 [Capitella teleta]|eukprot:ELU09994.1 hypothetical protein CAPTEDRAFT_193286 [Capitella teleta]
MLYSCESWLTDNTSGVNKLYMAAMKMLLGVRTTTPNSLCQIEIGISELKSTLLKRQGAFLRKFRQKSAGDEPLAHALNLVQREEMGQRLTDAAETDGDPELASLKSIRRQCRQKAADGATRYQTYLEMNPDLCVYSDWTMEPNSPGESCVCLRRNFCTGRDPCRVVLCSHCPPESAADTTTELCCRCV